MRRRRWRFPRCRGIRFCAENSRVASSAYYYNNIAARGGGRRVVVLFNGPKDVCIFRGFFLFFYFFCCNTPAPFSCVRIHYTSKSPYNIIILRNALYYIMNIYVININPTGRDIYIFFSIVYTKNCSVEHIFNFWSVIRYDFNFSHTLKCFGFICMCCICVYDNMMMIRLYNIIHTKVYHTAQCYLRRERCVRYWLLI